MSDGEKLVGPDGFPLSAESSIVVVKARRPLPPQALRAIGMITKSNVISLPLDVDIMMGNLAREELEAVHKAIHDILEIKE